MYLVHLDILGFDQLAQEIANRKDMRSAKVRSDFIDVIQEKVKTIESSGKITGKKYGESDDWLLAIDSFDKVYGCIYEILGHNTGYGNYEKIPLEIAIGKGEYDKWARFDGANLVVETSTIKFLKTNIVDYFRQWYKNHHNNESITSTFIVLTESVYLDLETLDKKLCQRIEHKNQKDNKTISFFGADVAKFQRRGKVLEFVTKIGYPGSKRYGRIDCVYVPPSEYDDIVETLREKRVVFITGTQEYGKTFTAVRLMWEYYENGYEPSWIKGSEQKERLEVRQILENIETVLKPNHIIYFEDPFGKTKYEKREGLERGIGILLDRIKQVENVYVIITSREEVFKEFEKEKLSLAELKDFEKRVGLKRPSYTYEKNRTILLNWAQQQDCKWLGSENLRNSVLDSLKSENILPTPLSMHDFAIATKEIENEDYIKQKLRESSKETGKAFSKEMKNMTEDKILFLSFPFIWSRFEVVFVELMYRELVGELNLARAWEFDRILKWFLDDKISLREGKYLEFSHPSYHQALEHLLQEENYPTWVNKEIFAKLLLKLAEKEESASSTAWFMAWQFSKVTEDVRNEILLKLSEKDVAAEYTAMTLARNFDEVPENIRNRILLKASKQAQTAQYHVLSLVKNFDKIPEHIRSPILLGASAKEKGLRWVRDILVDNIDKFSSDVLSELLSEISIQDNAYNKVAWAIVKNIEQLSAEVMKKSLLDLSQDPRSDQAVGWCLRKKFDYIPQELREELLMRLSKRDGIAGTIAWIVKDNFHNVTDKIIEKLLLNLSRHDGAANFLSLSLQDNFDGIPENLKNKLLLELCVKDDAALTIVFILKDRFRDTPEEVRNKLLTELSEKEVAEWVAWTIYDNFEAIPIDLRNKLLLKLSANSRAAEAVLLTIKANPGTLTMDFRRQILGELSKSKNEKVAKEAKET